MIKNKIFSKKFKKVVSLCLAGCVLVGVTPARIEAAKDKTKPKIKVEYHYGDGKSEYGLALDWVVITATDNKDVKVSTSCQEVVKSGYDSSTTKKKVITARFDAETHDIKITAQDSAGNKVTKTIKEEERPETTFYNKYKTFKFEDVYKRYYLNGKKLKPSKNKITVKYNSNYKLYHLEKIDVKHNITETWSMVDKKKPTVTVVDNETVYSKNAKRIRIKDFSACKTIVTFTDETTATYYDMDFVAYKRDAKDTISIKNVEVTDLAGNTTTVEIESKN